MAQGPNPAEVLADLSDTVSTFREFVNGQRAQFLSDGYSETAAEVMAMDLWKALIVSAFSVPR
jgi:hypothetical protein